MLAKKTVGRRGDRECGDNIALHQSVSGQLLNIIFTALNMNKG